jgi:putative endonuclease
MTKNANEIHKTDRIGIGRLGEDAAASYLIENGYRISDRNFRIGKLGEIDIVAFEKEFVCFIEVKTRTGVYYGTPSEAVGQRKQLKLRSLALAYLKIKGLNGSYIRFDIAEVQTKIENQAVSITDINLIKNAF